MESVYNSVGNGMVKQKRKVAVEIVNYSVEGGVMTTKYDMTVNCSSLFITNFELRKFTLNLLFFSKNDFGGAAFPQVQEFYGNVPKYGLRHKDINQTTWNQTC